MTITETGDLWFYGNGQWFCLLSMTRAEALVFHANLPKCIVKRYR